MINMFNRKGTQTKFLRTPEKGLPTRTYAPFGEDYRVVTLSTLYQTVPVIIMPSLKSMGQFLHDLINKPK